MRNFLGHDGFIWWIGIVEDINDPLTLGRCKVRCFGYHPAKATNLVPTGDLPWALTIHPLNTPNLYGTPRVGEWVFGFFLDALAAQEPAILGYLPAIPQAAAEYFGATPSLTRNFASVSNKSDILWDANGSSIKLGSSGGISIVANTHSIISSDKTLTLNGTENLVLTDSKNVTTLDQILTRIKALEDRLNSPTTELVPNTSITVITDI